jgi:hypothetical protein
MRLRVLMIVSAVVLVVVGVALAGWAPVLFPQLGIPALPSPNASAPDTLGLWRLAAFVRLFGILLAAFGLLLFALRDLAEQRTVRNVTSMIALGSGLVVVIAVTQQIAFDSTFSGALAALFGVMALAFGWMALRRQAA